MEPTTDELIKGCGQWKKRHCDDFGMTLCGAKGRICLECESRLQGRLDVLLDMYTPIKVRKRYFFQMEKEIFKIKEVLS